MQNSIIGIILLFLIHISLEINQYEFIEKRRQVKEYGKYPKLKALKKEEMVINSYLKYLKSKEYIKTKEYFLPSRPIEQNLKSVQSAEIYQILKKMPKGGNLHYHETQGLDRGVFLDMIMQSDTEYDMLYICDQAICVDGKYNLTYFKYSNNASIGWTKVKGSNWTKAAILEKTTFLGKLNELNEPVYVTNSPGRWKVANGVFNSFQDLILYNGTRYKYLEKLLSTSINNEKVQIMEFRRSNRNPWYFGDNGNRVSLTFYNELDSLRQFKKEYQNKNPDFIDFAFIIHGSKSSSKESISSNIKIAMDAHRLYPDLITGYDLVNEEDGGHTLLFHCDSLLKAFNETFYDSNALNVYFHAGETSWPEDYEPAQFGDQVATIENIYDSLVLETKRVGHGLGFAKYPKLFDLVNSKNVAIEICPTSNQMLGYVPDLRNHPGISFYRSGIPIVLAGDDPGSFGINELTVEYYMATMAWGLDLTELKDIAMNSVIHSSVSMEVKVEGQKKFNILWDAFIQEYYNITCNLTFSSNVSISGILPVFAPYDKPFDVSVYGYGYENAICKNIICQFGTYNSTGLLLNYHEIRCPTPAGLLRPNSTVKLNLYFDTMYHPTGYDFTFIDQKGDEYLNASPTRKILNWQLVFVNTVIYLILF